MKLIDKISGIKLPEKFHWARLIVVILLFVIIGALALHKNEAKEFVKSAFVSGAIPVVVWIYVFVAVLSKSFYLGNGSSTQFGGYASFIFSVATYGFAGTTSITLLQGVYLQMFYQEAFFTNFGVLDLASIVLVATYLLIYTGTETTKMFADVLVRANAVEAKPTDVT